MPGRFSCGKKIWQSRVLLAARSLTYCVTPIKGVYGWVGDGYRSYFVSNHGELIRRRQVRPGCGISIFLRGFADPCAP
jgi:hypothetical protein